MKRIIFTILSLSVVLGLVACASSSGDEAADIADAAVSQQQNEPAESGVMEPVDEVSRPAGWTEATHGNDVDPNYDIVFPSDRVNTITIRIDPADWEAMQTDMTAILGEPGERRRRGGGPAVPDGYPAPPSGEFAPPGGGPPPEGGFAPGDLVSETPMWVPATIEFDGNVWNHVGVRYKGNSSLANAWERGSQKLPFKFDFDEFEDDYPEIDNQRFYGFKQLSLANGFADDTYLRETLTYDAMRAAGLVAGRTAFYELILDYGEGQFNLGIYTVVEVVDDTVIKTAYGDDDGNIYEADGRGASLAKGTFDLITGSFEKENNEDAADWGDIQALYSALHEDTRQTDSERWRAGLEAVFDVDTFLNWLAVNTVVLNWDTYGAMTHNFYLYNNPQSDQLVWIPWDHNMTFGSGMGRGRGVGLVTGDRPAGGRNLSFDKADVGENWPLIRFLLDDPIYKEKYMGYLAAASDRFDASIVNASIEEMAEMLRPAIIVAGEEELFDAAILELMAVVKARDAAAAEFVAGQ